jgi:hypothetical protein
MPDLSWRFGCRICGAVHESSGINDYPETLKVIRKPQGAGVVVEYECKKHEDKP